MKRDLSDIGTSVDRASSIIKRGGVCAFPTETGYGLGALFDNEEALKRIFEIKKRPENKPLLLLIESFDNAPVDMKRVPKIVKRLTHKFWPGPLTLLLPAKGGLSFYLTGNTGKIGVRISSNPIAMELVKKVSKPITATSANLSGKTLPKDINEVVEQLKDPAPDYFLDGGSIEKGPASTIVDVSSNKIKIIREGAVKKEDILALC